MQKFLQTVSALVVLFLAPFAEAQFGKGAGPRFHDFKPVVGGWSEYQMTPKGEAPSKWRMAVVGKEGDAYWFETVIETKREGRVITKVLVSGDPNDLNNVKVSIVKVGNEPAMEMPGQMMRQGGPGPESQGKVIEKGSETVKVPAGTFTTKRMQYQEGDKTVDTWVHKDISPYGLVKLESKDVEMVLLGYGTGAKTQITETPQKFEMPQMPQVPERPQRQPRKK
jgi:hypothetical protein